MRDQRSAPHGDQAHNAGPVTFAEIAASAELASPLKIARAAVLHRHIVDLGSATYDELVRELVFAGTWSRESLDETLEDLAYAEQLIVRADLGFLELEPVLEDVAA